MSWRNKSQITGQNTVPLGNTRRWGGGGGGSGSPEAPPSYSSDPRGSYGAPQNGSSNGGYNGGYGGGYDTAVPPYSNQKRERDGDVGGAPAEVSSLAHQSEEAAPRKRRSRWGDEKTNLGVATALGSNVSESELEKYAVSVRLEEIAQKLRSGEVVPPERERSPSPPPTYDGQGRRTNTREVRYRKKLEEERVRLIDKQIKLDPNYKPPVEYAAAKRNMKPTEKVYLPIKEFPEINFFGLLVGPRGNTLKNMERESGAKISIRGKGSVKEGKGRMGDEDEEEMHCVVTGEDEAKVRKCIRLINQVIETAASTPETQNDHKRNQLRELAALNGTLRDDENQVCQNCGQKGHRKYECPEQRNWTAHIVCHRCGQQGHLARDCTQGRAPGPGGPFVGVPAGAPSGPRNGDPFNSEYENLMAELGAGSGGGGSGAPAGASMGPGAAGMPPGMAGNAPMDRPIGPDGKKIPPWRDPNVWNAPTFAGAMPRGPRMGFGGPGGPPFQQQPYFQQQQQQQWAGQQGGAQQGVYDYSQQQQQQQHQQGYGQGAWQQQQPANGQAQTQQDGQQPDYREAWEAYYRQQGMDPAAAAAAAAAGGATAATGATAGAATEAGQQDYTKAWEEYYRQQAAAAAGGQAAS